MTAIQRPAEIPPAVHGSSPRKATAATAATVSPTATHNHPSDTDRLTFLLGLPKLTDDPLRRTARRLATPVLISANALLRWSTDTLN